MVDWKGFFRFDRHKFFVFLILFTLVNLIFAMLIRMIALIFKYGFQHEIFFALMLSLVTLAVIATISLPVGMLFGKIKNRWILMIENALIYTLITINAGYMLASFSGSELLLIFVLIYNPILRLYFLLIFGLTLVYEFIYMKYAKFRKIATIILIIFLIILGYLASDHMIMDIGSPF